MQSMKRHQCSSVRKCTVSCRILKYNWKGLNLQKETIITSYLTFHERIFRTSNLNFCKKYTLNMLYWNLLMYTQINILKHFGTTCTVWHIGCCYCLWHIDTKTAVSNMYNYMNYNVSITFHTYWVSNKFHMILMFCWSIHFFQFSLLWLNISI